MIFSSGTPFSLRRDSEISPSQKSSNRAVSLQIDLNGHLVALIIGYELYSGHRLSLLSFLFSL